MANNMENRSMTTSLQTCLESTQVTEDERKTVEEWNTLKVQETNDVPNKIAAVENAEYPHQAEKCDHIKEFDTIQITKKELLAKQKVEEEEIQKKIKEEERIKKVEEQKRMQLKHETDIRKQKELKEMWDSQDKEDTLKRKNRLKEEEQRQNDQKEIAKRQKEDEKISKKELNEAQRLRNEKLNQQQKELKEKWEEQEHDNTTKGVAQVRETGNRTKDQI